MKLLALQFATCFAIAVSFGSCLFARYALSSRSVRSGRARSEIFHENIDYLHLIIFVRDAGQDVLILSRVAYLSLSGSIETVNCSFTSRKLKVGFRETFCVESIMHLALI